MRDVYLSTQFGADLDRLGWKVTRKVPKAQLDALEASLTEVADGESEVVLDLSARAYLRAMWERAQGRPPRVPDFEEVVQASTWLPDPADPRSAADSFDTSGDVAPAGLLCLGEWKSGELWVLDVAIRHGYVFLITERRAVLPIFRTIGEFAQWAVANELWKRRLARDGEVDERLGALHVFRTLGVLRENGLVPPSFRPKRFRPLHDIPTAFRRDPG